MPDDLLIRCLAPADAPAFQSLRLQGLRECPEAFASSWEEECETPLTEVARRLVPDGVFAVYGGFSPEGELLAVAGLGREALAKMAHKATLWGMYVAPHARRRGIGGRLLRHVLACAASDPRLRRVNLGVHAANTAARSLYESMGFVAWGTEPAAAWVDGQAQDETWMSCELADPGSGASRPALAG